MKDNFYVLWVKADGELIPISRQYESWARKEADDRFGEGNWIEEKMTTRTEWVTRKGI